MCGRQVCPLPPPRLTLAHTAQADEFVKLHESLQYGGEQAEKRKDYLVGKQQRAGQALAMTRLGYLQWLTTWWRAEFDQLHQATGFGFDPDGVNTVDKVTEQILVLEQQNNSLVRRSPSARGPPTRPSTLRPRVRR